MKKKENKKDISFLEFLIGKGLALSEGMMREKNSPQRTRMLVDRCRF